MSRKSIPKCYNFGDMPNPEPNELSERELDILKLVATGASNKEIARKLFISSNTVKVHLRNIFNKIGVTSRTEAAMYAVNNGLVETKYSQIFSNDNLLQFPENPDQLDQSIPSYPSQNRKLYNRYIGLVGALVVIVVIFGIALSRGKIIPPSTQILSTPTQRVQWFELPGPPTPRRGLAVTSFENQIFAIGGESAQGITNTVEMYDPQMNKWSELTSKPTSVSDINAGVIGGLIYVPGGKQINGSPTDITEIYDPNSDKWLSGISLPKPLCSYGLAVSEGRIYIFGGWDGHQIINNGYVFDPQKNTWTEISPMPYARSFPGAIAVGRNINIIGGWDGKKALTANEIYLPDSPGFGTEWTEGPELPSDRYGMGITSLADIIFIIGGTTSEDDLTVIALSQEDENWGKLDAPIPKGWFFLGATTVGTRFYVLGGSIDEGLMNQMWSYQAIFTITLPILPK
jgi:DNA-binding CsgD family transcriptional regulator